MSDWLEEHNKKAVEKSSRLAELYSQTMEMLRTEERFVNFFKSYDTQSVERFIEYYAQQKTHWHEYADSSYRYRMGKQNKWRYSAVASLKEILGKKIFNLKCRWVAGEMDLPGIELSYQFNRWLNNSSLCAAALEHITPEELQCYMNFLESDETHDTEEEEYEEGSPHMALQFFHHYRTILMDKEDCDRHIPRWFRHYDACFGTAPLMELSTIRTDLEEDYQHIWLTEVYPQSLAPEQRNNYSRPLSRHERKELKENPEKEKAYREEQTAGGKKGKKTNRSMFH